MDNGTNHRNIQEGGSVKKTFPTYCHHCGKRIVWNVTIPRTNSHWAHAITTWNGKTVSIENALMQQSCDDTKTTWATPARKKA
jgi:hypothetical protein